MPTTFCRAPHSDRELRPFLLRELIHNDYLPELIEPTADISQADWEAYHADMQTIPMDLPTPEEVLEMARTFGLDEPPF
jgi:hypothetical protein